MSKQLTKSEKQEDIISSLVLNGDLSKMSEGQKTQYYKSFCDSLGLNPLTQPFEIINFQGKERLYAKKDATEQLRKINGISVVEMRRSIEHGLCMVTVKMRDKHNREDIATGVVPIENLKGDNLANAIMKAETKGKRRCTLSISGLGMLDESEIETIPNVESTGGIKAEKWQMDELKRLYAIDGLFTDDEVTSRRNDFKSLGMTYQAAEKLITEAEERMNQIMESEAEES